MWLFAVTTCVIGAVTRPDEMIAWAALGLSAILLQLAVTGRQK